MPNQDTSQLKEKIYYILKRRGPSLPVHIAKEINLSMLFTSAFLSELYSDRKIKISSMKVGGSPVYFVPGHEYQLEKYSQYLGSKEREAFELLRKEKVLKDSEQQPAIRVALRALRDFAIPFKNNNDIFWRYLSVSEQEVIQLFEKPKKREEKIEKEVETKPPIIQQPLKEKEIEVKTQVAKLSEEQPKITSQKKEAISPKPLITSVQPKPLITIKPTPEKKPKPKSLFILKILRFLEAKDIELLEEISFKKKEFEGLARINSDLGKIELYVIAKDKKKVTENDLTMAVQKSQSNRKMILLISNGNLDKKAEMYLTKYLNIVKFLKI